MAMIYGEQSTYGTIMCSGYQRTTHKHSRKNNKIVFR